MSLDPTGVPGAPNDLGHLAEGGPIAAVDLGSNSFHMIVAESTEGQPTVVDRLRERVGLLEGLEAQGGIDPDVEQRALDCLARFGQRLANVPPERVRSVGTATFREVRDQGRFRMRAEAALGHPIEILPGKEEARLVYLGVAHSLGDDAGRRLVMDIGGGSTEVILGERFESLREHSLSMGCVRWTQRFFRKGKLTAKAIAKAELAARMELEPVVQQLRDLGWSQTVGSSGTILAISEILNAEGWADGTVTQEGLDLLTQTLINAGDVQSLTLTGVKPDRLPVLAGGLVILRALFAGLGIEELTPSNGALREGLLYDLLGRIRHEDVRSRAVLSFASRLGVNEPQASRVMETALALFDQTDKAWSLGPDHRDLLSWAAWLHGVGLAVSFSGYHRHGAYLIEHADLPGFSREDRARLATVVQSHRKRPKLETFANFQGSWRRALPRITLLLRAAIRLRRTNNPTPTPTAEAAGKHLSLTFPEGWLDDHPMTAADLAKEVELAGGLNLELAVF